MNTHLNFILENEIKTESSDDTKINLITRTINRLETHFQIEFLR